VITLAERILTPGALTVLYQPIVRLEGSHVTLYALECLTRGPAESNAARADVLFDYVRFKRLEPAVDRACCAAGLAAAAQLPSVPMLSLNVHATTIGRDREFSDFLQQAAELNGVSLNRLTLEVVEHSHYAGGPAFCRALNRLRELGLSIALDDVGLGHSNYRRMLDARPEYLKIDRYLVCGASTDPHRRAVVESIATLAQRIGARVIAEGIESDADLDILRQSGIELAQGYLLARPMSGHELEASGWLADIGTHSAA